jgi:acetate kinase
VIRSRICEGLGFLGIELDTASNQAHAPVISQAGGRVTVRVMRTDEELQIATASLQILAHA